MHAAFVTFDGVTVLDFVGVDDRLGRLRTTGLRRRSPTCDFKAEGRR